MSDNKIINMVDSNNNTISNVNKNKINNTSNNSTINYFITKKKHNKEENKKNKRPGLKDKEKKIINFEAMVVGTYRNYSDTITIINVHSGEKYMADHTQLRLKETLEELIEKNGYTSCLLRSVGQIYEYISGTKTDFGINILDLNKITFLPDIYYNPDETDDIYDVDVDNCYNKLMEARHNDMLDYIEQIRILINELTNDFLTKDFLYHYIINQYSLNTLNYDMYYNSLQSDEFDDDDLYRLILILGNVLFDLQSNYEIGLYSIMKHIAMNLNTVQNVISFNCVQKESKIINKKFKKYCEKLRVGFGKGWEMVVNRNKDFGIDEHVSQKDLAYKAMLGIGYNLFN